MRVLLSVHLYFPGHKSGGERYIHNCAKYLQSKGHEVRVFLHQWYGVETGPMYMYDGIEVFPPTCGHAVMNELFLWSEIICTHLDFAKWSIFKSKQLGKPCVFFVQNTSEYYTDTINSNPHTYVVYNAQHAKDELKYNRPSIILHPTIEFDKIVAKERNPQYITLINLCKNKGVRVFNEIARRLPDKQFLGVAGSYMKQEMDGPENIKYIPQTEDMQWVYGSTRILLVPSDYESFSMCAAEAMANGVPVICSPTPGLLENCQDAAIFIERGDGETVPEETVQAYVKAIKSLDNPSTYGKWVKKALERTKNRLILEQLQDFENLLICAVNECKSNIGR